MDVFSRLRSSAGAFGLSVLAGCLLATVPQAAFAQDAYSTRPTAKQIRQAVFECEPATGEPESGIIGISDPHAEDAAVASLIAETGVRWARVEIRWSEIDPTATGRYDWSKTDAMVDRYNKAGIRMLAILTYIPQNIKPDWAEIDRQFQNFAATAVRRYARKGVHYWEIFNEPNLPGYGWLVKGVKASDFMGAYTLLLARANKAVRDNDPQGFVVLGGLASDNRAGITAEKAMGTIYEMSAGRCFDILAFHPYGYQNKFPEARKRIDAMMAANRDGGKPIWFNEYGWTDYRSMDMKRNRTADTNPMMAVFKQRGEADALFWFSAKDYSAKLGTPTFGLADFSLRKRPSFDTFKYLVDMYR
jgi:hypothetical protein